MNTTSNVSSLDKVTDTEWYNQYLLADMVRYMRKNSRASGFIMFDYSDLIAEKNKKATLALTEEILSE